MEYDIESILEMYEDDYNKGQLVQPNADGSRPGYGGEGSGAKPGVPKSEEAKKAMSESKQKKSFARYNTAYDTYDGQRKDIKKYTYENWKKLDASQKNQAIKKVEMKLEPGAYKGEFGAMTEAQKELRNKKNRKRYAESSEKREKAIKNALDYYYGKGGSEAQYKADIKKTKGKATLAKEKNRLLKYMETAFNKGNVNFEQILDKEGNFVGIKDKTHKINGKFKTYVPFEQYETRYKNNKNYLPITKHRDYKNFATFFDTAKRFKFESPDTTLGSYFQKYERVPTYSEIYNFFQRDPRFKGYRQNALEIHHRALMENKPTRNLQLTLFDKNNKATSILDAYKNPDRPEYKNLKLVDQQLKDLGVRVKVGGRMLGISEELPGQTLETAKKETVDLFKQKVKENPKIVEEITQKLKILGCPKGLQAASGGRIKFSKGTSCEIKGKKVLEQGLKNGFKKGNQQVLAEGILKSGRFLKDAVSLRGLFGPLALGFTVAAEAGLVGYDMLSTGKSFREAVGDSVFNYALGDKTKIDSEEEIIKRLQNIKTGPSGLRDFSDEEIGKMQYFKENLKDLQTGFDLYNQLENIKERQETERGGSQKDLFSENAFQLEAAKDKIQADIQDYNRTGTPRRVTNYLLSPEATAGADAAKKAQLLVKQDQLKDAGIGKFYQSPIGDEKRKKEAADIKFQLEQMYNPTKLDEFGEYFISRPQSEQSYMMGLGYKEGGIASLNVKK